MYRLEIITHPLKMEPFLKSDAQAVGGFSTNAQVSIQSQSYIGTIGLNKYILTTDFKKELLNIQAQAYEIVILTNLLEQYSIDDYLEMCKLFIKLRLGSYPDRFEIHKFQNPKTTHIYPIIDGDYLYVCEEENNFLYLEPYSLLGLYPITDDPMCWVSMQLRQPIILEGACLIRSEDKDPSTIDMANKTLQLMEQARRKGLIAEVTKQFSGDYDTGDMRTCRMQYGPIRFWYDSSRDLYKLRRHRSNKKREKSEKVTRKDVSENSKVVKSCLSCDNIETNPLDALGNSFLTYY